jgi:hypothetical protein
LPVTLALPSNGQVINEIDLPADGADIPAGTTVDEEVGNVVTDGGPAPTSAVRLPQKAAAKIHIETVVVKFSQTVSLKKRPTFVFTFASGYLVANANYYIQLYDSSNPALGWQDPFEGPATVSGSSLLFTDESNKFTFEAGVKYKFDLYAVSSGSSPTPFPAPSVSATATPKPTPAPSPEFGLLTVTPGTFGFTATGQSITLSVAELGFSGTFNATVDDPTLASIVKTGPSTFIVTALSNPGFSFVKVTDGSGQSVKADFSVTITSGVISRKARSSPAP